MNLTESKKTLALSGVVLGIVAAALAFFGNPKNMAICIACFIRDTAEGMKLHQAAGGHRGRPWIFGIVGGAVFCLASMHISEAKGLLRISFVVFRLKKNN